MAKIRTFVAVDVSPSVRNSADRLIQRLRPLAPDYNWVEKDRLHITLNFLGDVDDTEVPAICKAVERSVDQFDLFEIGISGLGCFPSATKPRIVWLGVQQGSGELLRLNDCISGALEPLRFPRERKDYVPHLTLGRIRRGGHYAAGLGNTVDRESSTDFGESLVDQVVVYSSFLDRSGPTYTPMAKIDLGG